MIKRRDPALIVPGVLLVLLISTAILAPAVTSHDPLAQNVETRLVGPSRGHIFGTDGFGRDIFSRILHGARVSLYVGLLSVGAATLIGISIGIFAAYRGGWFDLVTGRIADILLGFPYLVLAIVIIVALESSPTSVAVAISVVLAPRAFRLARAGAQSALKEQYIEAARTIGAGHLRIAYRHLLPNCIGPTLAQAAGFFGTAIATETILSYVGLGIPPPYPSWGRMIQEGTRLYVETAPWLVIFPGIALCLTVMSFTIIADRLRRSLANGNIPM